MSEIPVARHQKKTLEKSRMILKEQKSLKGVLRALRIVLN